MGETMFPEALDLAKVIYSFIFSFGLLYILFLGGELATSNMMYFSASLYYRTIRPFIVCSFGNFLGAMVTAWLFSFVDYFQQMTPDFLLPSIVHAKLDKTIINLIIEGIIASVFVKIAVLSFFVKNQMAKIVMVLSAITMFVSL